MSPDLARLHFLHAHCVLRYECSPPLLSGMMWSTSGALSSYVPRNLSGVAMPHSWQRQPSRAKTLSGLTVSTVTPRCLALRLCLAAAFDPLIFANSFDPAVLQVALQ